MATNMSLLKSFVLLMGVTAVWCQECTDDSPDQALSCPELVALGGGICNAEFITKKNKCARSCGRKPCPPVDAKLQGSVTLIGKVTGEKVNPGPPPASITIGTTSPPPASPTPPPPTSPTPPPPASPSPPPPASPSPAPTEVPEEPEKVPAVDEKVEAEVVPEVVEEAPEVVEKDEAEAVPEVVEESPGVVEKVEAEEVPEVVEESPEVFEKVEAEEVPEVVEVVEEAPAPAPPTAADCKPLKDLIAGEGELSFLKSALETAGLIDTLNGFNGVVFAPTNAAFNTLLSLLELSRDAFFSGNAQVIEQLLKIHVIPGAALTLEQLEGQTLTPLLGGAQKVSISQGGSITSPAGPTARVAKSLNEGCPGIIHVIDNVIIPRPGEGV